MLELVDAIMGHLGTAIGQSLPQDDQIIMGHVEAAQMLGRMLRKRIYEVQGENGVTL